MAISRKPDSKETRPMADEVSRNNSPDSEIVQALSRQVANALVLYANYKHYHWQVFGPLFRDLHKLFDKFAAEVLATVDPLAERIRMIGQNPPAHLLEAVDSASVTPAAPHSTLREMLEEANRHQLTVIKEIRAAVRVADEHDDPGTTDLLSSTIQVHEKHEWWVRDMLRSGDGLVT